MPDICQCFQAGPVPQALFGRGVAAVVLSESESVSDVVTKTAFESLTNGPSRLSGHELVQKWLSQAGFKSSQAHLYRPTFHEACARLLSVFLTKLSVHKFIACPRLLRALDYPATALLWLPFPLKHKEGLTRFRVAWLSLPSRVRSHAIRPVAFAIWLSFPTLNG